SPVKGTTTDPVQKAMELLPLGPVVILDTPGLDDEGDLGQERVKRAYQALNRTDLAVLVVDAALGLSFQDQRLLERIQAKKIPYLIAFNKTDLSAAPERADAMAVSAKTGAGVEELKERIAALAKGAENSRVLLEDLVSPEELVVLVTPIDASAPKGRMILPQVQSIRSILDRHAACLVTQPEELTHMLGLLNTPPRMVITDSQVFSTVKDLVPEEIPLTSFSILFARYKGILETATRGAGKLGHLRDGDRVLISEGCTHHRQCQDIGTVKLPGWIRAFTGKGLEFQFTSGTEFPEDLSPFSLVIHCGGCMLTEREVRYRMQCAQDQGIPFTNYGTAIAHMNDILKRSLSLFPDLAALL
ncbi:MAG: [Oscillospiraceae bacterium]|nr:[FeFe] hydrogenase H-cluster maturation GTPase HydF [Oscillospiraceae bacterium]